MSLDDNSSLPAEIVIATGNAGKREELAQIVRSWGVLPKFVEPLDVDEPHATFAANARVKAKAYADEHGCAALSEDSGLIVPKLFGAPGVYTARYAESCGGWEAARDALWQQVERTPTSAALVSALCFVRDNVAIEACSEVWGELVWPPSGPLSFGFETMFQLHTHEAPLATQMTAIRRLEGQRASAEAEMQRQLGVTVR